MNGWLADAMGEEFRFLHEQRMRLALGQARRAAEEGEVPVGAVIYRGEELVGSAWNQTRGLKDPTAHAEMLAITQAAAAVGDWRLEGCTLYVTKEPCPMCAAALAWAQIPRIVYGADDPRRGYSLFSPNLLHPRTQVTKGILGDECAALMKDFFKDKRR